MRQLPTGTVTFLFSDIEGSTKLLDELGAEAYAEALAEHRRVMRAAFAAHGGVEVDTQGDAFFAAFPEAQGALAAAGQAQSAFAQGPIQVRMGIHSGEPLLTGEGYVGIDVHRGARVMSAGHGGQVLVSEATFALLDGEGGLVELGRHRLKDLTEPQPLYQLGEGEFPPLKTLYQTNLPVQPTPLVGREAELADVLALMRASPLLTLTGAGGSGKTRLALQAAAELVDDFKDGVWWVSLAALRDPALVEPTIAQVVGAKDGLADHLRDKHALLLLDNFEQLLEAAPGIAALLAEAPDLRVVATSRARLGIRAEQEYVVPTLVLTEAVALFTARARHLKPGFEPDDYVEEICRRLDGLPLALELAAARIKVLTSEQILARLGRSLQLLTAGARDAPERQQTLRATIDWSYALLAEHEERLFAHLAVFAGSFDLEAAEAICKADLDTLQSLVDKSLLRQGDEGRFWMHEAIREYADDQLEESGEAEEVRQRHAEFFATFAERGEHGLRSSEQAVWLERLTLDVGNLRAALRWSLEGADPEPGLRLCAALMEFWFFSTSLGEANPWIDLATSRLAGASALLEGRVLYTAGVAASFANDSEEARPLLERALTLVRDGGDRRTEAGVLVELSVLARERDEHERSIELAEEAVCITRELGDDRFAYLALHHLAERLRDAGEHQRGREVFDEVIRVAHESGRPLDAAYSIHSLGDLELDVGDLDRAQMLYRESLGLNSHFKSEGLTAYCLAGLASVAAAKGAFERAARLWGAVDTLEQDHGVKMPASERGRYERHVGQACETERAGVAEGQRLEVEKAVELALRP